MLSTNQLNKLFFYIFFLCSGVLLLSQSEIEILTLCTPENEKLKEFETSQIENIDFNIIDEYNKEESKVLSQGSSWTIKRIQNGHDKYSIKLSECTKNNDPDGILSEIQILIQMNQSKSQVTPNIHACVYKGTIDPNTNQLTEITHVYLVLTAFSKSLAEFKFDETENQVYQRDYLIIIQDIVFALKQLWDAGFVHGDLKSENIFYDEKVRKYKLANFQSSKKKTFIKSLVGTVGLASPGQYRKNVQWEERDDLYSLALVAVGILNTGGTSHFLNIFSQNDPYFFEEDMDNTTKIKFMKKSIEILQTRGFGELEPISTDSDSIELNDLNFTTLMAIFILYDLNKFTFQEIIDAMDEVIRDTLLRDIITNMDKVQLKVNLVPIFKKAREYCLKEFIIEPYIKKIGIEIDLGQLEKDSCRCRIGLEHPICRINSKCPLYGRYDLPTFKETREYQLLVKEIERDRAFMEKFGKDMGLPKVRRFKDECNPDIL